MSSVFHSGLRKPENWQGKKLKCLLILEMDLEYTRAFVEWKTCLKGDCLTLKGPSDALLTLLVLFNSFHYFLSLDPHQRKNMPRA